MARRRKSKKSEFWGRRLGGVVILAFFIFGMVAGVSAPGHALFERLERSGAILRTRVEATIGPLAVLWTGRSARTVAIGGTPIVLVERWNGFYTLSEPGELTGPILPGAQGDLPILSGPAVASATAEELMEYATLLVRAEANLSVMVSEMRVDRDGVATLYLNRTPAEIAIDADAAPLELRRAAEVLDRWHGHEGLIAVLDMTTPAQAIVRLRGIRPGGTGSIQKTAVATGVTSAARRSTGQ